MEAKKDIETKNKNTVFTWILYQPFYMHVLYMHEKKLDYFASVYGSSDSFWTRTFCEVSYWLLFFDWTMKLKA